jgi:hypothetical protein
MEQQSYIARRVRIVVSFVLSLLLCVGLFSFALPSQAEAKTPGETVSFTISLTENAGDYYRLGFSVAIPLNKEVFEYVSYDIATGAGSLLENSDYTLKIEGSYDNRTPSDRVATKVSASITPVSGTDNFSVTGTLVTVTLRVKEGAPAGEYTFEGYVSRRGTNSQIEPPAPGAGLTLPAGYAFELTGDTTVVVEEGTAPSQTPLAAPVLSAEAVGVTTDSITLAAPATSAEDEGATVAYRISSTEDFGEAAWQESPVFEGLNPDTSYYFQAKYIAIDEDFADSEPSAFVVITTQRVPGEAASGDLNGDGYTTAAEALTAARAVISGSATLTSAQRAALDMDSDGALTMADVVLILRKAANL